MTHSVEMAVVYEETFRIVDLDSPRTIVDHASRVVGLLFRDCEWKLAAAKGSLKLLVHKVLTFRRLDLGFISP